MVPVAETPLLELLRSNASLMRQPKLLDLVFKCSRSDWGGRHRLAPVWIAAFAWDETFLHWYYWYCVTARCAEARKPMA
jgi:hypothetical protein